MLMFPMLTQAAKPAFFVGVLDFLLANEDDLMDFAGAAVLDPAEVGRARDALAGKARAHGGTFLP